MRTVAPRHRLVALLAVGLLTACASGPQKDIAPQGYRYSIPIMPEVSALPTIKVSDPRRWPVREVQSQVAHCWSIERDGRYNDIGSFRLEARLAPDGSVVESEVVNAEGMLLDPVFRELALSAQQALTDCGPLPLPPADYEAWRELTFRFMPYVAAPEPLTRRAAQSTETGPLTVTEKDSFMIQVSRCWYVQAGLRNADSQVVELRIALDPDGTVRQIEVVDEERLERDPSFGIAAKAAIRAVRRCGPFDLPPEKYEAWKVIVLHFDPGEQLKQLGE